MSESLRNEEAAASIRAARMDAERLIREGVPEPQVLAQLDVRLGEIAADMNQKTQKASGQRLQEQIALLNEHIELRRRKERSTLGKDAKQAGLLASPFRSHTTKLPQPYRGLLVLGAWLIGLGLMLEITIGRSFVFAAASAYRSALPWLLAVLVLLMGWLWYALDRVTCWLTASTPRWWVRWLLAFPMLTVLSALLMIPAPMGWLAVYGALAGQDVREVPAKMVRVGEVRPTAKGCSQTADVLVMGNTATICLERVLVGTPPSDGAEVVISGRLSGAGIFIDELRGK